MRQDLVKVTLLAGAILTSTLYGCYTMYALAFGLPETILCRPDIAISLLGLALVVYLIPHAEEYYLSRAGVGRQRVLKLDRGLAYHAFVRISFGCSLLVWSIAINVFLGKILPPG